MGGGRILQGKGLLDLRLHLSFGEHLLQPAHDLARLRSRVEEGHGEEPQVFEQGGAHGKAGVRPLSGSVADEDDPPEDSQGRDVQPEIVGGHGFDDDVHALIVRQALGLLVEGRFLVQDGVVGAEGLGPLGLFLGADRRQDGGALPLGQLDGRRADASAARMDEDRLARLDLRLVEQGVPGRHEDDGDSGRLLERERIGLIPRLGRRHPGLLAVTPSDDAAEDRISRFQV